MPHAVLTALGLTESESGTYLGSGQWGSTRDAGVLESISPTDGALLARVQASSGVVDSFRLQPTRVPRVATL